MARPVSLLTALLLSVTAANAIKPSILDDHYVSDYRTGKNVNVELKHVNKLKIPNGQCSGEVSYPENFSCDNFLPPDVLKIKVRDPTAQAQVRIRDNLLYASVYRQVRANGTCNGEAIIEISIHCEYL